MINWRVRLWVALLILCTTLFPVAAGAQTSTPEMPAPHLGYGVHLAPNTPSTRALVDGLGVDWVKIYDPAQAKEYKDKRILYRMDLSWPKDWEQFKIDVANRARELVALDVTAVEVGNEPNLVNEWVRQPNAWEYVQMLRVAYTALKAGNPNIIVVSAGLAPTLTTPDRKAINDLDFLEEMLGNGAGQWFDALGYHPYGYNQPPEADPNGKQPLVFRRVERVREIMEKHGVFKQVWLTEFGWLRNPSEDNVSCSDSDADFAGFAWLRVSSEQQAAYLVRAFQYADRNWPYVGPMFVWNLNWQQQTQQPPCSHQRWFSLLKANGEPTLAYQRLQALNRRPGSSPRLELRAEAMTVEVSLACLKKVPLGTFSVHNVGYPLPVPITVSPVNSPTPPFVEVDKREVRAGDTIKVFVNPVGLSQPGQYTVYINVKATVDKRPYSQNMQGYVVATMAGIGC